MTPCTSRRAASGPTATWIRHNSWSSVVPRRCGPRLSVASYDVSALSADTGYQLTAELRHTYSQLWYGRWQTIMFIDDARVSVNRNIFAPGPNTASLYGAGVGLNWA